jgi:drug/metabolite transporter (DMT)-like permease
MTLGWIYIILVLEQIVASGTFVAAKWALEDFPPLTLAFLRFMIAAAGLYLIRLVWPNRKPIERRDWGMFALLGFLAVMVNQAAFLYGLRLTTPTHAAIIYGATPVFVFLLAIPLLRERATWLKFSGVVVTFAGVIVIVIGEGLRWEGTVWVGDLLILGATGAWALYTVLGKPMVVKYGAVHTTAVALITGTTFFVPIGLFSWGDFGLSAVTSSGWLSLLYIAIGTSVICYTIWFWALGRLEATKVAVFNNFQPVITAFLSLWLMQEPIGARLIAGGVLVIIGVILTERG